MNLKGDFRDVMKEIPTSVSILLVRDREEIKGCTISSLVSVDISSENPHVMFVLRKDSGTGESIQSGRDFSINLLNQNQIHIANLFANKFSSIKIDTTVLDLEGSKELPQITDCNIRLICNLVEVNNKYVSVIYICRVKEIFINKTTKPLIYWNRNFCEISNPK